MLPHRLGLRVRACVRAAAALLESRMTPGTCSASELEGIIGEDFDALRVRLARIAAHRSQASRRGPAFKSLSYRSTVLTLLSSQCRTSTTGQLELV